MTFSTSLLIGELEELQCTNMHPTISPLSAILSASLTVMLFMSFTGGAIYF